MVEEMFVFLLYECLHPLYNFFRFFSFCYESSFCNRVMISCSIHGTNELHSYKEFLCNSSFSVRFEASAVKAMRPILTNGLSFQYVALASSLWRLSWCRSRHTWRWESRIISSPRTSSRNHSPNSVLSKDLFLFCSWTLSSDVLT